MRAIDYPSADAWVAAMSDADRQYAQNASRLLGGTGGHDELWRALCAIESMQLGSVNEMTAQLESIAKNGAKLQ